MSSVPTVHPARASSAVAVDLPDPDDPANNQPRPEGSVSAAPCTWCSPTRRTSRITTSRRNDRSNSFSRSIAGSVIVTCACVEPGASTARPRRGSQSSVTVWIGGPDRMLMCPCRKTARLSTGGNGSGATSIERVTPRGRSSRAWASHSRTSAASRGCWTRRLTSVGIGAKCRVESTNASPFGLASC